MFRIPVGIVICRKTLWISRGRQFYFSAVQRQVKNVISEVPKENINHDVSIRNKEFAKVIKFAQDLDEKSVHEPCDQASQEIPLIHFSAKSKPSLVEKDIWQDESLESSDILQLTNGDLQHELNELNFQHTGTSHNSSLSDSVTAPEILVENEEIELLNGLENSDVVSDLLAVQNCFSETNVSDIPKFIIPKKKKKRKKKKKKVKEESKNDAEMEADVTESAPCKELVREGRSDAENIAKKTVSSDVGSHRASGSKANHKGKKPEFKDVYYKYSSAQHRDMVVAARNKQHMQTLKSYINLCISTDMVVKAHKAFHAYHSRKSPRFAITDIEVYDALISGWAQKGELKVVKALFKLMKKDGFAPSLQSYASYLECLARNNMYHHPEVKLLLSSLEKNGLCLEDLFVKCKFTGDQAEKLLDIISHVRPGFIATRTEVSHEYTCKLLEKLNNKNCETFQASRPQNGFLPKALLIDFAARQMEAEEQCVLEMKSVNAVENVSEKVSSRREQVKQCEEMWRKSLSSEFMSSLHNYRNKVKFVKKSMSLEPYLTSVDRKIIVDIMIREIRFLAENCENFSPSLKVLHHDVGEKIMNHYFASLKKRNKIVNKVLYFYEKYSEYLISSELSSKYSPREYWELLKLQEFKGPTMDAADIRWSYHTLCEVGKFLYDIILEGTGLNCKLHKTKQAKECLMPVFTVVPINAGTHLSHQVRVHPRISQMYREAELESMYFDVSLVPMMCPPRPWNRVCAGGLLITHTPFVRLPQHAPETSLVCGKVPSEQLNPCFDSLNILSLCPWIINKPMLDLIIEVFKNNGCVELDIPLNPKSMPSHSEVVKKAGKRSVAVKEHLKKKSEMASLWFDCLYKLTIANHFRDRIFWFPHNLDFRGRVYPTPPHFNHLGSDMVRSILLFAEGKPLGENGLNWLKIHLINLTGFKKREPISERLKFADEMMPEILDSADYPFTGNLWWETSDEPWQTLACCKEIANAVRSPDPKNYISHFPVHQDGSCNGLQHYAALGRDEFGALEVNLHPSDSPRDVYSTVAALVEEERKRDAANGSEIAKALEGFVQRKVVKQTVMTYVYGVTPFGAKLQILKQLKDIPTFPEALFREAVRYLSDKIFSSIAQMFTATQQIQNWFTDCADVITRVLGKPVEWVTPLGLPVVQPYHREVSVRGPSELVLVGKELPAPHRSTYDDSQRPNVMKQKNAFPPNFIHSLDSSHMMLTALFCHREGITFVSVHDCFWTHPCSVEVMNRICREQFVALHSEPILEHLSEYFLKKYLYNDETVLQDSNHKKQLSKLKTALTDVPNRGSFKLDKVLNSVYFFS